jgi:predicted phosphoribosyltransferase
MMAARFPDRREAGRLLAVRLEAEGWKERSPVVLALPRGGVEVAAPIAEALAAPLDVLVVRKIGAPGQPEFAVGAVGAEGAAIANEDVLRRLRITPERWSDMVDAERAEVERRIRRYRGDEPPVAVEGRDVIVVDDGVATGATATVALRVLRARHPRSITVAVPVAPPSAVNALAEEADEVVVLNQPIDFMAVGQWYDHFDQTSDERVIELLDASR